MATYGRQVLGVTGNLMRVSADGQPEMKVGGVTIDWTTVPPVRVATTLADGNVIPVGASALPLGTILCKITASGLFGPWSPPMSPTTLNGATLLGATSAVLTSTANIVAGDRLTIDTSGNLEVAQVAQGGVVGSTVTFTAPLTHAHADGVAVTKGLTGQQALTPGECYVLDQTVFQTPPLGLVALASDHPAVLEGGLVYLARLQVGGTNQPTFAQLLAAMPRLRAVEA